MTPELRGYKNKSSVSTTTPYLNYSNPPASLDWRSKNGLTSVKNQGMCGADWAFAVTAYAESKLIIDGKQSSSINLSDQQVLQCTTDGSCSGGYLESGMTTVIGGLSPTSLYGYNPGSSSIGICTIPGIYLAGAKVESYYSISDNDLIQLLQERPVAVAVSSVGWETYSGGVFTCVTTSAADHAALLVGYNTNYWILKNSWGDRWGESGFIRISRVASSNCKIGGVAVRTNEWHLMSLLCLVLLTFFMIVM